jgi:hypothetical protein
VNVTLTAQLDPAVTVPFATHVVPLDTIAKSPAFAPAVVIEKMVRSALPVFETVIVSAPLVWPMIWPPKTTLAGETLASGAAPVPVKLAVCGLFGALSATESVPVSKPPAVGAKTTLIMQLPPAATLDPQLLVSLKLALTALTVMPVMVSGLPSLFVK